MRAPLEGTDAAWLLMVDIKAAAWLSISAESPEKALTAVSSAVRPDPTAFRTFVMAGTSRSTGVPRPMRTGSAVIPRAMVARVNAVLTFMLTVL